MHISLITSLYRSDKYLPTYIERLLKVGQQVADAGLALEVIVIANDATELERQLITDLVSRANEFIVSPSFVPRETLYASWNRAIKLSSGECLTVWNVDDDRSYQALIEGYKLISEGCDLVDFPYSLVEAYQRKNRLIEKERINIKAFHYDEEKYRPLYRARVGTFFMYRRTLYDQVGPFDERFKVCGDVDWAVRAAVVAKVCRATSHAGKYFLHGKNLSMGNLLAVEENIVILCYGQQEDWNDLQIVPPKLMRDTWAKWETRKLPPKIEQRLWGTARVRSYRFNTIYRISNRLLNIINRNRISRATLSRLVTKRGLRPILAKIGLVKSRTDPLQPSHQNDPVTSADMNGEKTNKSYTKVGPIPWSLGYPKYKMQFVHNALLDNELLDIFREGKDLPIGYGQRLDERVIEFPWVYAHLGDTVTWLLDAGSTMNHTPILSKPRLTKKSVVIYTLAPEVIYSSSQVSYIYGDLRDTILRNDLFDDITCISTLEHIGMDNTMLYTADEKYAQTEQSDYLKVMKELARVLKPGGHLWLTVPYGKSQNMGWQQQFDRQRLQQAINAFGGQVTHQVFYKYSATGWQISTAADCDTCEYFDIHVQKNFDRDYAAAARAVACLGLTKPL